MSQGEAVEILRTKLDHDRRMISVEREVALADRIPARRASKLATAELHSQEADALEAVLAVAARSAP